MRKEHDMLGDMDIPKNSFTGIHTQRALGNFMVSGYKIDEDFIKAYGLVKLACSKTVKKIKEERKEFNAIIKACEEMAEGKLSQYIVVDALQGGAGTSLNMNINEVLANRALEILGEEKGSYTKISPLNHINKYQSTNDTFPTALKIAAIIKIKKLEKSIIELKEALERKGKEFYAIVKIGRTELTEAVLTTLGKEFSAYADVISRDYGRICKCKESLKVINLGGTAIGTGVGAPKKYISQVIEELSDLSGIGLVRAKNLVENTQNADIFSEFSGVLKTHATNLIKIANDLRLMSSYDEITLPPVQAGSSIMPGKINPVIPEMTAQVGLKVLGNDVIISHACALGQLELNQHMPLIAFTILESLNLLINTNKIFARKCIKGIEANEEKLQTELHSSTAILTALLPKLGYEKLSQIAEELKDMKMSIKDYVLNTNLLTEKEFDYLISAKYILSL